MSGVDNSIGAFLIGTVLSSVLTGITIIQVYFYYLSYAHKDHAFLLSFVGFLTLIDLFHTGACAAMVYYYAITTYGQPDKLLVPHWTYTADPMCVSVMTISVQFFYARRVYLMSGKRWFFPALICLFSLVQFGFAIGAVIRITQLKLFSGFSTYTFGVTCWLVFSFLGDFFITTCLVYYLYHAKSDCQKTNTTIDEIIRMTVETNATTMVVALADTFFFAFYKPQWHIVLNFCLLKLYFNSLLVSLNSRKNMREKLMTRTPETHPMKLPSQQSESSSSKEPAFLEPKLSSDSDMPKLISDVHITVDQTVISEPGDDPRDDDPPLSQADDESIFHPRVMHYQW